ncbi:MAG: hypothetical protein ACJAZX_000777 [Rickettsiales bacterium]|jgi:hypothetical protein
MTIYQNISEAHKKIGNGKAIIAMDIESTLYPFMISDGKFRFMGHEITISAEGIRNVCQMFYYSKYGKEIIKDFSQTELDILLYLAEGCQNPEQFKKKIEEIRRSRKREYLVNLYKSLPDDFLFTRGMRLMLQANKDSDNKQMVIASVAEFYSLAGTGNEKMVLENLVKCGFSKKALSEGVEIFIPNYSLTGEKDKDKWTKVTFSNDKGFEYKVLKDAGKVLKKGDASGGGRSMDKMKALNNLATYIKGKKEILFFDNRSDEFEGTVTDDNGKVECVPFIYHETDYRLFPEQGCELPTSDSYTKSASKYENKEDALKDIEQLEQQKTKNIKTKTQYSTADNKIVKILVKIRDKNVFLSKEEKVHNLRDPIYKELKREDVPINSSDRNKMCEPLSQDLIDDMARNRQIDAAEAFLQLFEQIQGNPIVEVSSLSPNPEPNSKENFELKDPMYAMASLVNIAPGDDLKALFGDGLEEKMNAENKVEFVAKKSLQTEKLSAIRTVKYVIPKDLQEFSINTKINQYTENKNFRKTTDTNLETLTINKTEYFPTAFIVHGGGTVGGHYIAYVKCDDNKWYRYNDDGCDGPLDETEVFFIAAKDSAMIKYSTKQAGLPGKQANGINNTGNTCWMNALLAYGLSFKTLGKPITKPSETIAIEKAKEKLFLQLEEFAIAVIGKDPVLTSEENTKLDQAIKESISESENISTSESALLALLKNVFTKIGRAFDAAGNTDAHKKIAQEKEEKLTAIKDTFSNIEEDIQNKIIEKIKAELVTVEKINNLKEILKQTDTKDNNTNKINSLKTLLANSLIHGIQNMTDDEFSKRLGLIVFISEKAGKDAGGIEATKENVVLMLKAIGDDSCSIKNLEKQFEVAKEAAKEAAKDLENARKEMRAIAKESGVNFYEPTIQELKKHLGIRRTIDAAKKEISDAIKKENGEKEVVGLNELLKDFEEELITIAEDLEGNDEAQKVKVLKPLLQKKLEALGKRGGAHVILAKLDDRIGSLDLSNGKTQYSTILKVLAGDTEAFKILTPPPSTAEKPRAIWIGDIQIIKDAKDVGLLDENGDQGKGYEIPTSAKLGNKDEVSGVTEAFRKSVNNHKNAIDTEGGEQNFDNPIVYCGLGATFEMSTITIDKDGKVVIPLLDIFEGALGWELGLTKGCVIKIDDDENAGREEAIKNAIQKIRDLNFEKEDLFASDGKTQHATINPTDKSAEFEKLKEAEEKDPCIFIKNTDDNYKAIKLSHFVEEKEKYQKNVLEKSMYI